MLSYGGYSSLLLITLMYQANQYPNGASGYSIVLVVILLILSTFVSLLFNVVWDSVVGTIFGMATIFLLYPTVIYIGMTNPILSFTYECNGCTNRPFILASTVQTVILGMVFAVYSCSPIPKFIFHIEALELHLTRWWRITQAILSISIALGIGLFAQFVISSQNIFIVNLIPLITVLGIGIVAILVFIFWKMYLIELSIDRKSGIGHQFT